jgi:hypothetical protein
MILPVRWASTMAALAALLFPWATGVFVAAHLVSEGHHHASHVVHEAAEVRVVVHGHHHGTGSPAHEHALVVAKPAPLTARVSLVPASAQPLSRAAGCLVPIAGSCVAPEDLAHGPPLIPGSSLILRI